MPLNYTFADAGAGAQITSVDDGTTTYNFVAEPFFRIQLKNAQGQVTTLLPGDFASDVETTPNGTTRRRTLSNVDSALVPAGSVTVVYDIVNDGVSEFIRVILQSITLTGTGQTLRRVYVAGTMRIAPTGIGTDDDDGMLLPYLPGSIERNPHNNLGTSTAFSQGGVNPFDPNVEVYTADFGAVVFGGVEEGTFDPGTGLIASQWPGLGPAAAWDAVCFYNRTVEPCLMVYTTNLVGRATSLCTGARLNGTMVSWMLIPEDVSTVDADMAEPFEIRIHVRSTGQWYDALKFYKAYLEAENPSWLRQKIFGSTDVDPIRVSQRVLDANFHFSILRTNFINDSSSKERVDDLACFRALDADSIDDTIEAVLDFKVNAWDDQTDFVCFLYQLVEPTGRDPYFRYDETIPAQFQRLADEGISWGIYIFYGRFDKNLAAARRYNISELHALQFESTGIPLVEGAGVNQAPPTQFGLDLTDTTFASAYREIMKTQIIQDLTPAQRPKGAYLDAYNSNLYIGSGTVNYLPAKAPASGGDNTNGSPWLKGILADSAAFRTLMRTEGDSEWWHLQENSHMFSIGVSDMVSHKNLASAFGHSYVILAYMMLFNEYIEAISLTENGFRSAATEGETDNDLIAPDAVVQRIITDFISGTMGHTAYVPLSRNAPGWTQGWSTLWEQLWGQWKYYASWDRVQRVKEARRWGDVQRPFPGGSTDALYAEEAGPILLAEPADGIFLHPDGTSMIVVFCNYDFSGNAAHSLTRVLDTTTYPFIASGAGGAYAVEEYDADQLGGKTTVVASTTGNYTFNNISVPARSARVFEITPA